MAIEKASLGDTGMYVETTRPDRLLRHNISDEELGMLCSMGSSHWIEAMWFAVGAFIGVLPTSIMALLGAYYVEKTVPISGVDLIHLFICMSSLAIAGTIFLMTKDLKSDVQQLEETIKQRGSSNVNG